MDLSGKVALITGGNRGIGLEICRQLAGHGLRVVLTARKESPGEAAAQALRDAASATPEDSGLALRFPEP